MLLWLLILPGVWPPGHTLGGGSLLHSSEEEEEGSHLLCPCDMLITARHSL